MTAAILDFAGLDTWRWASTNGTQQAQYLPKALDVDQPTATLGRERSYLNRSDVLQKMLQLAIKSPNVQQSALVRALSWTANLPDGLPNPFVAIGDDGSVSTEWDVSGCSLHVTFDHDVEEAYFVGATGEEWEFSLDAIDMVSSAMRTIALSAQAQR